MGAVKISTNANFKVDAVTKQLDCISLKETGYGSRRKAVVVFRDAVLPLHDNAGTGGEIVNALLDLPEGLVSFEGGVINLTVERASGTTTSLSDTWTGMVGLGSTVGVAGDLATTEQDFVQKTVPTAAVGGKATVAAVSKSLVIATPEGAPRMVDNTAGGKQMFLNILVDDASQDGSTVPATVKLNGTVTVHYTFLGDK